MKQSMETLTSSESNEWYTPPWIVERVTEVLTNIDLDPASSELANKVVKAETYFSNGGLNKNWFGKVFLNPPYGRGGTAGIWLKKAFHEYLIGNVNEIIVLTKSVPGYIWYDRAFHGAWFKSVCITWGRISFYRPEWVVSGEIIYPKDSISKTASTFWYSGDNIDEFERIFSELGTVFNFMKQTIYPFEGPYE
jgi:hypothetical protein